MSIFRGFKDFYFFFACAVGPVLPFCSGEGGVMTAMGAGLSCFGW